MNNTDPFEEYQNATTGGSSKVVESKPQAPKISSPSSPTRIKEVVEKKYVIKEINLEPLYWALVIIFCVVAFWYMQSNYPVEVAKSKPQIIYKKQKPIIKYKTKWKTRYKTKWKTKEVVKYKTDDWQVNALIKENRRLKENLATARLRIKRLNVHHKVIDKFFKGKRGSLKVITE